MIQVKRNMVYCSLICSMRPDYPQKHFNDKRNAYVLLIQSLACGGVHYTSIF